LLTSSRFSSVAIEPKVASNQTDARPRIPA
jgi:hypothetical protein